ncbi:HBS1-like protein isoform X2 [Uloborus diversus]|uniref:HBS1-like protein isoform X2 n=1 Tax=Uloborus diversus TaxID=327109 RepID=UPI002409B09E|nr:HBS1-like protein isoform X2 [Uloborus diversus]
MGEVDKRIYLTVLQYEGYYSCYGHSVEDDFCISPSTEAQFLYDRNSQMPSMRSFLDKTPTVPEEDFTQDSLNSSNDDRVELKLSSLDTAKFNSCVEAVQDIVGDTITDAILKKVVMECNFDLEKSLNVLLTDSAPKPQRVKKTESLPDSKIERKLKIFEGSSITQNVKSGETKQTQLNRNSPVIQRRQNFIPESIEKITYKDASDSRKEVSSEISNTSDLRKNVNLTAPVHNDAVPSDEPSTEKDMSSKPVTQKKYDAFDLYTKERSLLKTLINLIVIGHVDAGKSTLMGHLLFRLGQVSKRTMHKFEQDSKKLGKSSFMYAWVLDETDEERNRGITMDVAQSKFETHHRSVVLLDAPGHKDFIPNMITGAAQADVAILVVDSTRGEFETGFEAGGQTREHTMLIRSLGVSQIAIAVNKMDNVNWSQERYNEIKGKMSSFLKQVGFKENDVTFVPCSGLSGENLISSPQAPELKDWYTGPTLVEVIDNFQPPERAVSKPLRMCISDVFKGTSGGFCVAGKIEAGAVKSGEKVSVLPAGEQAVVKGITLDDGASQICFAGDHVIMQLTGVDINNVSTGSVICDIERPVKVTSSFEARLVIFNVTIPITKGFPVILHYQSFSEQALIKNLISLLSRSSGEVIKRRPRCLPKNSSAVVEMEVNRPICIELFKEYKELGRFMLRCSGSTIAAGMVTSLT